ncbi:hypothetical protein [Pandoraea sp. XY-2]|nr:hypothetical protein [Pandoraea sp. XY-2]
MTPVDAFAAPGQTAPAAIRIALGTPQSDAVLKAALEQVADVVKALARR